MATRTIGRRGPSGPTNMIAGNFVLDPAAVPAASVAVQSVAVPGIKVGDFVQVLPPNDLSYVGVLVGLGTCNVDGTLVFPILNPTAAPIDPASGTFTFVATRG